MSQRIVSLIASSTEIICALGFKDQLVGRSHECDYPKEVESLPKCSEPKFNVIGSSVEIDQRVKAIVKDSLSVYRVDAEKLKALKPDVIVTQDHCEVCAVSLKDVENAVCEWMNSRPTIVSLSPNSLEDVWKGIEEIAETLGEPERGRTLVDQCRGRLNQIATKAKSLGPQPEVACIEWMDPLMCAGNWVPELLEMAHAKCLFGEAGKHSPWMSWDDLHHKNPEIIVIMPCGWGIERILQEMHVFTQRQDWRELRAVREDRVYLTDGNQYFNRPGPRLVESLEIIAEILYPEAFSFGHKGIGWMKYSADS